MEGVYLTGYIETTSQEMLVSQNSIKHAVESIKDEIGISIVTEKSYQFGGTGGITYCFILAQSHLVIHTWPEESKIFFDLFFCNGDIDEKKCAESFSREFRGKVKGLQKIPQK